MERPESAPVARAILAELERQGFACANARHLNAVTRAAAYACAELGRPHVPATDGMGIAAWLACDETGESSLFLWSCLDPNGNKSASYAHPCDAADFLRCVGLLRAVPGLRERLPQMTRYRGWAPFVSRWADLEWDPTLVPAVAEEAEKNLDPPDRSGRVEP
jgi:hypothetical protein